MLDVYVGVHNRCVCRCIFWAYMLGVYVGVNVGCICLYMLGVYAGV